MKANARRKGRLIPIRKLAEYAADPEGFARTNGGVRNKAAAAAGRRGEARVGTTHVIKWVVLAALVTGGLTLWRILF